MGYFNTIVKPTIPASNQTGAFAQADLLFDWYGFDIPRGAAKLVGVTAVIRKTNGTAANELPLFLLYAKSDANGDAPSSLGTPNATVGGTGYYNNIIGKSTIITKDFTEDSLDVGVHVASLQQGGADSESPAQVLQGEPDSGTNVGYDKLYVGGIAGTSGIFDFSTNVFTTGTVEGDDGSITSLTVDNDSGGDPTATKVFAVGDVLHAEDDIVIGTVKTIADTTITFESGLTGGDLADSEEIYNFSPITLILSFEQ